MLIIYGLPTVTFFNDLKAYDPGMFSSRKGIPESKKELDYLHVCVCKHLLDEWFRILQPEKVEPVIKDFDLTIEKGSIVGIQGPVGCGKSSIFSCILGEMKTTDIKLKEHTSQ